MKKLFLIILLAAIAVGAPACRRTPPELPVDSTDSTVSDTSADITDTSAEETDPPEAECRLLSLTVSADKNKNMYEDLVGEITDGTVSIRISAPIDTFSLKNAVVDVETDAAAFVFTSANGDTVDLTSPDCTLVLTDKAGISRTYEIRLFYAMHTLPVVSITTENGQDITSKETYVNATVSIDAANVNGWYLPLDYDSLAPTEATVKGRGNSTWGWDKKPYKIKFSEKTPVLGLAAEKDWVLLANYADYSLIRNYLAFETAKELSPEIAPLSQLPVNLFVNGEYRGVYSIGEDKEVKTARIELPKDTGEADTSFLLEVGGLNEEDVMYQTAFSTELLRYCSIEYPKEEALTQEQADYILSYCQAADAAIKSLNGYEEYVDVDSLIDWFIINELFYNLESCFRRSCFLMKEPGGKLKMGPIWDFDLAAGNLYNDFGNYEAWACLSQSYGYIEDNWFCYLLRDTAFRDRLNERWDTVKSAMLARALQSINGMYETLPPNAAYNFALWDTLGTRAVLPQPLSITEYKTYEDNVKYLRDFIITRWIWMDKNI